MKTLHKFDRYHSSRKMFKKRLFIIIVLTFFMVGKIMAQAAIKRKATTYATVMDINGMDTNAKGLKFEYTVKGKTYKTIAGDNNIYLVSGDRFKIEYDSLNPVDCKILFEEPLFLPTDKIEETEGTLKEVHKRFCIYRYYHGREYTKMQYYYEGTVEKYHLKKGDKFEIDHIIGFPNRAIIYFDKPY